MPDEPTPDEIAERLAGRGHHECEDCWYSCPLAEGACNDLAVGCTCGYSLDQTAAALIREQRAVIDALLAIPDDYDINREIAATLRYRMAKVIVEVVM